MKNILIVVDMQNDFVDGALGTLEAQGIIDNCVRKINSFDGDIIVTYDTHNSDYLDTNEGRNLPIVHCVKGTRGWELNSKIQKALNNKSYEIIEKNTFGAKKLPLFLKENYDTDNIEVEFIGLCTDICVISNALLIKAFFPEIEIFADESCMAGVTVEKHKAAIETMKSCQIKIV